MQTDEILREVTFNTKLNLDTLYEFRGKIKKRYGIQSKAFKLVDDRVTILKKRKERSERKNYSTKIKFSEHSVIDSGLNSSDFDVVKQSRKKNWIAPFACISKGYTRKKSEIKHYNRGRYHPKYASIRWEYAPIVTSYIHYTTKRVIVCLEDKVYRYRYSGKYFHFEKKNNSFYLVHTKSRMAVGLTAYAIIYKLPQIRKKFKTLNYRTFLSN